MHKISEEVQEQFSLDGDSESYAPGTNNVLSNIENRLNSLMQKHGSKGLTQQQNFSVNFTNDRISQRLSEEKRSGDNFFTANASPRDDSYLQEKENYYQKRVATSSKKEGKQQQQQSSTQAKEFAPQESVASRHLKNREELEGELLEYKQRLQSFERNFVEEGFTCAGAQQTQLHNNNTSLLAITATTPCNQTTVLNGTAKQVQGSSVSFTESFQVPQKGGIVQRLQKIEDFYQNRTRLLEERIEFLERENERLESEKEELAHQNGNMQEELREKSEKFLRELQKSLREQEERLNKQFEMNLRSLSSKNKDVIDEQATKKEQFCRQLEDLKREKQHLLDELDKVRDNHRNLEDEKNSLSMSYNNLLSLHNQMLQFDIQKNEKSLHSSSFHSITSSASALPFVFAEGVSNLAGGTAPATTQLHKRLPTGEDRTLTEANVRKGIPLPPTNQSNTNNNTQQLAELVSGYRHEFEEYRQRSVGQTQQMREQMAQLRGELEVQQRENQRLEEELKNYKSFDNSKASQQHFQQSSGTPVQRIYQQQKQRNLPEEVVPVRGTTSTEGANTTEALLQQQRDDINRLYSQIFLNDAQDRILQKQPAAKQQKAQRAHSICNKSRSPSQESSLSSDIHPAQARTAANRASTVVATTNTPFVAKHTNPMTNDRIRKHTNSEKKIATTGRVPENNNNNNATPNANSTKRNNYQRFKKEVMRLKTIVSEKIEKKKDPPAVVQPQQKANSKATSGNSKNKIFAATSQGTIANRSAKKSRQQQNSVGTRD